MVAHGVDFGFGLFKRRAGFFPIAREVVEPGFLDQDVAEIESHTRGFGDVAHPGQILPGPFEIVLRPPETGAAEIPAREILPGAGLPPGSEGGIELRAGGFVAGARGDAGQIEAVEADDEQPVLLLGNLEGRPHPFGETGKLRRCGGAEQEGSVVKAWH